jgi:hypothetical protein
LGDRLRIADSLEALAALACEGPGPRGACEGAGAGGELPELEVADSAGAVWRAARLFGAAAALREAIGAPMPPSEHEAYRRRVCRAREMLGEAAFDAARAEGRAMTPDQAIAYALQENRGV